MNNINIQSETAPADNTNSYIVPVQFGINKLIKTLEYNYEIEVDDTPSNWPVVVLPRSGQFIAASKTKTIDTVVMFCPNTGICDQSNPDVLPYNLDYSCGFKNQDLFVNLRLKVNEKGTTDYRYSQTQKIQCLNCFSNIKADIPSQILLDQSTKNTQQIVCTLSNLTPGQKYFWSYNKKLSNWPAVLYPSSGSFTAPSSSYTIDSLLTFCRDVRCSGSPGYLSYTEDHLSSSYKYIDLDFSVNDTSTCYLNDATYGVSAYCNNCIPYASIVFNANPLVSKGICSDLLVSMSGLDTNQTYRYNFSTYAANWPLTITPISGEFTTSDNTSVVLPFKVSFCASEALCSDDPNLIDYTIDYTKIYTNMDCDKYAYLKYNLQNIESTALFNALSTSRTELVAQSDVLNISCDNCLDSPNNNAPTIESISRSPTTTPTGTPTPTLTPPSNN